MKAWPIAGIVNEMGPTSIVFSGPITPLMAVINSCSREKFKHHGVLPRGPRIQFISGVVITPLCLYVYNPSDPSARPFLKGLFTIASFVAHLFPETMVDKGHIWDPARWPWGGVEQAP